MKPKLASVVGGQKNLKALLNNDHVQRPPEVPSNLQCYDSVSALSDTHEEVYLKSQDLLGLTPALMAFLKHPREITQLPYVSFSLFTKQRQNQTPRQAREELTVSLTEFCSPS